jgi:SAM-dependent methyltransferase
MHIQGYHLMLDAATKFYHSLRLFGWFHHPKDELATVSFSGQRVLASVSEVGLPHGGVLDLGPNKGFTLQVLRAEEALTDDAAITFTSRKGWTTTVSLAELCDDRLSRNPSIEMMRRFYAMVASIPRSRVLDIGGRDRSGTDRSRQFPGADVTVLDIHPGENVDVVADAHALAAHLPEASFDVVFAVSVFEHLLMPWAVIAQINRVLKPGGIVLIGTHQTVGLHDMPWDFWRFSDTAWDGLFNRLTGFEIVERVMEAEQHVLPYIFTPIKQWAERAAGFESSMVLARKTGPCTLAWPVTVADLTATSYPGGTEDPFSKKS